MTVTTVIAALQTINGAVASVDNAPTDYPSSIEAADLPMVITWPGSAESGYQAGAQSLRTYQVTLYVKKIGDGRGIAEGWNSTKTMLQGLLEAYMDSTNHQLNVAGVYDANVIPDFENSPVTDSGFEVIAYPPPATGIEGYPHYFGVQFNVMVKERW
jgi:hypothetical protein